MTMAAKKVVKKPAKKVIKKPKAARRWASSWGMAQIRPMVTGVSSI